jgi:acyl-CoA thioester hydrolase
LYAAPAAAATHGCGKRLTGIDKLFTFHHEQNMNRDEILAAPEWDVERPYVEEVRVGSEHLDRFGHTNNVVYLSWLEQVAWGHSLSLGLDFEAYERIGAGCVARRHELDYLAPTFTGDRLWLATWVHENDFRLSMWRRYQIVRESDRRTVLRGQTQWVCVDMQSGKPRRMPAEFRAYAPWPVRA